MLEKYYHINEALGVSIHLHQNGSMLISACQVNVDGQNLDISKKVVGLTNAEALAKEFQAKSNVTLNLSGKGILYKKTDKITEINQQNFSQVLPNARFEDFYVQNFISGAYSFISVIRKTEADKWVSLLDTMGFAPLALSLGPFPVQNIIAQLNFYDTDILFYGHFIQRDENLDWLNYQYKEQEFAAFPLKIESEAIPEQLVLAYATAFQLVLAEKVEEVKAGVPALQASYEKLIAEKKLKVNAFVILSVFFSLLLINFVVFSWLNADNIKLTGQVSQTMESSNTVQVITDQVKEKEALLQNLGWDGGINKAKLIDDLAALLPGELSWKELTINPVDASASRVEKSLHFLDRKIRIIGYSEKIIPVNEWIARVKVKKWVKNIQLDSYIYNNELNTGQFTVLIEY